MEKTKLAKKRVIKVSTETAKRLELLKHPGQSWDGLLREMLERLDRVRLH